MKLKLITFLCGLLIANTISAQDLLVLKDGNEIQVKVLEVQVDLIKYKKSSNLEGPIYSMEKDFVFMIKYENGTKDVFGMKQDVEVKQAIKKNPEIEELEAKHRKLRRGGVTGTVIGSVGLTISVPFLAANIIDYQIKKDVVGIILPGLTTLISSVSLGLGIESLVKANHIQNKIRLTETSFLQIYPSQLTASSYAGSSVRLYNATGISVSITF